MHQGVYLGGVGGECGKRNCSPFPPDILLGVVLGCPQSVARKGPEALLFNCPVTGARQYSAAPYDVSRGRWGKWGKWNGASLTPEYPTPQSLALSLLSTPLWQTPYTMPEVKTEQTKALPLSFYCRDTFFPSFLAETI